MAKKKVTVNVSERALMARVNRKLRHKHEQVRKARGFWDGPRYYDHPELGRYYVVSHSSNTIEAMDIDLESLARDLGVLAAWEKMEE
jgi:hypothetical protein